MIQADCSQSDDVNRLILQLWLTDLEVLAVLLSALMHDFEHTGTTNAFHVNTRHVQQPTPLNAGLMP